MINEKFENSSTLNYVYKEITIHFFDDIPQDRLYIQDVFSHVSKKIYAVIRFLKTEAVFRDDKLYPLTEEKLKKIIRKVLSMVLDAYSSIKPGNKTQYQGFLDIFINNLEIPRDLIGK